MEANTILKKYYTAQNKLPVINQIRSASFHRNKQSILYENRNL